MLYNFWHILRVVNGMSLLVTNIKLQKKVNEENSCKRLRTLNY